jgi:hypothetical protein
MEPWQPGLTIPDIHQNLYRDSNDEKLTKCLLLARKTARQINEATTAQTTQDGNKNKKNAPFSTWRAGPLWQTLLPPQKPKIGTKKWTTPNLKISQAFQCTPRAPPQQTKKDSQFQPGQTIYHQLQKPHHANTRPSTVPHLAFCPTTSSASTTRSLNC